MFRKNFVIMCASFLILISINLSGCSKTSQPETAKIGNQNQTQTVSNTNNAVVLSNNSANNVLANAPNATASVGGNSSMPTANKDKKPSPPVKEPTPVIGSGGGDMALFTQARGALSSDKELINAVIIEIKEGNVTLTGNVSSEAQKTKAAQLVQSVKGIKSVKNNLRASL